jgi:hypothetical protein
MVQYTDEVVALMRRVGGDRWQYLAVAGVEMAVRRRASLTV